MNSIIQLAILGFTTVASIGPTNLLAIKEGVRKHWLNTFFIMMGGVLVDIFYATLAGLGLSQIGTNIYFQLILIFVGTILFFYIGISGIKVFFKKKLEEANITEKQKKLPPIVLGILMTLPNPFVIVFWATTYTSLNISYTWIVPTVIFSVGLIWCLVESLIIRFFRKLIKEKYLKILELLIALVLIAFGIKFAIQFVGLLLQFTK